VIRNRLLGVSYLGNGGDFMPKWTAALTDLLSGLLFVALAFFSARVLLQSPTLTYLCFPPLVVLAIAVGFWRGRRSSSSMLLTAFLATAPVLILALYFFSGRNKPFIIFPVITFVFVATGAAFARFRANAATIAAVLAVAAVAGAFAGPPFVHFIVPAADVVERAIPFTIHLADGTSVSSRSLRGKVVVLDFWATWCVPCRRELPLIESAYRATKGQQDVAFFAIDGIMTDAPGEAGDTAERALAYFGQGQFSIPLAWDGGAVLEKTFALHGFPSLLVMDRAGRVRMRHTGFIGGEDLTAVLTEKIARLRREGR
jgi:thiol-disulfide isomerase/thioredoxin